MNSLKWCSAALAACVLIHAADPSASAAPPAQKAVDPLQIEADLIRAQQEIATENLNNGLKQLAKVRLSAGATNSRIAFLLKLADARTAALAGDESELKSELTDARKLAVKPDELAACWQVGFEAAKAAATAKSPSATALLDFVAKEFADSKQTFAQQMDMARLRLATNNPPAAENALQQAGAAIGSPKEQADWTTAVAELAAMADGGQTVQAGIDLFERLRKSAPSDANKVALDVAEGMPPVKRREWAACQGVLDRAVSGAQTAKEQALPVLRVAYELSAALQKAELSKPAADALAKAEALANTLPPSIEATTAHCAGLTANGQPGAAAELAWKAAEAARTSAPREQMLQLYAESAVAAAQEREIAARLKLMQAPASVYAGAARTIARADKTDVALELLLVVPAAKAAEDPKAAGEITNLIGSLQAQSKRRDDRLQSYSSEFAAAVKRAAADKAAKKADEDAKKAAAKAGKQAEEESLKATKAAKRAEADAKKAAKAAEANK